MQFGFHCPIGNILIVNKAAGIGTVGPSSELHVVGTGQFTGQLVVAGSTTAIAGPNNQGNKTITLGSDQAKAANAGSIGYQLTTSGAVAVYGARNCCRVKESEALGQRQHSRYAGFRTPHRRGVCCDRAFDDQQPHRERNLTSRGFTIAAGGGQQLIIRNTATDTNGLAEVTFDRSAAAGNATSALEISPTTRGAD